MDATTQARMDEKLREMSEYVDNAFARGYLVEDQPEHGLVQIEIDVFAALRVVRRTATDEALLKLAASTDPKIQRAVAFAASGQTQNGQAEDSNSIGVRIKLISAQTDGELKDGPLLAARPEVIARLIASGLSPKMAATEWRWRAAEESTGYSRPPWGTGKDLSIQQAKCKDKFLALKKSVRTWLKNQGGEKRYA